jgi:DNA-binding NarL/FixJ family response regulator
MHNRSHRSPIGLIQRGVEFAACNARYINQLRITFLQQSSAFFIFQAVKYSTGISQTVLRRYATAVHFPTRIQKMKFGGYGNAQQQVADEWGISEITVKAHRGRVTQKMKAESLP